MAIGFGFNKAKVLSSAEKFVQQGKLPNAIAEYEKVIREDPKDLTVLNTIGDLYARVGNNDRAAEYFKRVGDQYASNGFTVKAIAIYKKLTKLAPATTETTMKLAELYTQQGLFNDARAQYMLVANQLIKGGDNTQAARIFQKILEMDPENGATQQKLADLYLKLGRKDEARNIYYTAAESLYARGLYDGAAQALDHVLNLDSNNANALLLRGTIAADAGDSQTAIQYLQKLPDLDSRPDALRALLRAKLQSGNQEGVESLANKLFTTHQDMSGISAMADWYLQHHQVEEALRVYDRYSERFMTKGAAVLLQTLYPLIGQVRTSTSALTLMFRLLQKVGDISHLNEVMEMLAHLHVQKGEFVEARDYYKQLSEMEPENPLHTQNYKQMLAKLGEDSAIRPLSAEEGAQAFMVEEIQHEAPEVRQTYPAAVERAIEAALTDAELFVSYNVGLKAIAPLEAALPLAPGDVHLNQRLATLYAKAERYEDAARTCRTLSEIYKKFGHAEEAERYSQAAESYSQRASGVIPAPPVPGAAPPKVAEHETQGATVKEFLLDVPGDVGGSTALEDAASIPAPVIPPPQPAELTHFEVRPEHPPEAPPPSASGHAIDISDEWEEVMSEEHPAASAPHASGTAEPAPPKTPAHEPIPVEHPPVFHGADPAVVADKVQEVQFYISQGFWDIAHAALNDLEEIAPDAPEIAKLADEVSAGRAKAEAEAAGKPVPKATAMYEIEEVPPVSNPHSKLPEPARAPDSAHANEEFVLEVPGALPPGSSAPTEPPQAPPKAAARSAAEPKPAAASASKAEPDKDVLADFVLDLEESLGDFSLEDKPHRQPTTVNFHARPSTPARPPAASQANGQMQDTETAMALSDILSELQEDFGDDEAESEREDPETHYNLGIAFKEMGLLDEAIGELQKVCHAMEQGSDFSQPIQAYTWLAQCLVDKGVPEAAVRWYEKALKSPGLDHNSQCALHYDLGAAYEASGDKKAALANFMEVYGSNIDFRDVSTRIKSLKS